MPKRLEAKLAKTAKSRGYGAERTKRYVWGTLAKLSGKGKRRKK